MSNKTTFDSRYATRAEQASALALGLARAEEALEEFSEGQLDAVVDPIGRTYLLRGAQDLLRQKEKRLQEVIDSSADVLTVVNRGGTILSQSAAVGRVLGYKPDDLIGSNIFSHVHPADLFTLFSAFLSVMEDFHESDAARFRHAAQDGSYRALEATLRRVRDTTPALVILNLRPIAGSLPTAGETAPKREVTTFPVTTIEGPSPLAAEDKTPQLGSFNGFPDFIVLDDHGCVKRESSTLPRLLGHDPGSLVDRSIFEFVHPDDQYTLRALLLISCRPDSPTTFDAQFRHRMPNGTWSMIDATIGTLQSVASSQIIVIFRHASHLRLEREETAYREANFTKASMAKDKFLAMLSHELRTPLSPIFYSLTELEEDDHYAEARPIFAMIRRNLDMQARLLDELSYFTTVDQHKVRLHLEPIEAHEAIRFVVEICRSEIAEAGISMVLDLRATKTIVLADSVRLQQIMWNLLKNAIKFSDPGGIICISSLDAPGGRISIAFADQGIGIKSELLPLVFDPFQQGDSSIRPLYGGLGLGLFIAKGLADAQQAELVVESAGEKQGATFRLSFLAEAL